MHNKPQQEVRNVYCHIQREKKVNCYGKLRSFFYKPGMLWKRGSWRVEVYTLKCLKFFSVTTIKLESVYSLPCEYRHTWINSKANNKDTRMTLKVSLLSIFTVNFTFSGVFVVNFEHISHLSLVFLFIFTLFLYKRNWKIERY